MKLVNTLRALGAAALAVSLAGCVKMDMQLELNSDDTVDGSIVVALSRDVMDMAEASGEDPTSMFEDMGTDLPDNATAEAYEDDEYVGQRYTFTEAPLEEFTDDQGFGISHVGDEFIVTGEMQDIGGMDDAEGMGDIDLEALGGSFDIKLSITFPGKVLEHNGELDGTTVTWVPTMGETTEIHARAKDSGGAGGAVWLWVLLAVVVLLAILAGLFFLARRRGGSAAPATDAATSEVAADATAPAAAPAETADSTDPGPPPPPAEPRSS